MARKLVILYLCFITLCHGVNSFIIPTQRPTATTTRAREKLDLREEIITNEKKISNLTRQISEDYRKYRIRQ
ncbi:unnamed protein product [Parnassius apollo]|uniref:(apollo) hypothetical protein n=1 Tax=Parnassius apollo TaxID=110799 RepID=A0A8S3YAK0_PARAO|nr:unnamed protein product [Parnassius apollo]